MKRKIQIVCAGFAAVFAVTGPAWAGIPVAGWATPYVLGSAVIMLVIIGVTAMLKPSDVEFKDITSENSPSSAVIGHFLSMAFGVIFMVVLGVGVLGALVG